MYVDFSWLNNIKLRIAGHKNAYKKENSKLYKFIKKNKGWENFDYEIIQNYPTNNLIKLRDIENEYQLILKPTLNSMKSLIFGDKNEYKKQYRIENKEKRKKWILENSYKIDCPCGSKVKKYCLSGHYNTLKHINYLKTLK